MERRRINTIDDVEGRVELEYALLPKPERHSQRSVHQGSDQLDEAFMHPGARILRVNRVVSETMDSLAGNWSSGYCIVSRDLISYRRHLLLKRARCVSGADER